MLLLRDNLLKRRDPREGEAVPGRAPLCMLGGVMWLLLNGDGGNKNRTAGTEPATQGPGWWKEPAELPSPCLWWGVSACWRCHALPHPWIPQGSCDKWRGQQVPGAAGTCSLCMTPALPPHSLLEEALGLVVMRAIIWYGDQDPPKAGGSVRKNEDKSHLADV